MSMFKKATKSQTRLRLAITGVAGAGKTYTALTIGKHLGQRIALIDTERGSASKYSGDVADFDVLELEQFPPREYVKAIKAAEGEGYDVLIIDSLSHAWAGKGGALEMVDEIAARMKNPNNFAAWKDVTPEQHMLIEAILQSRMHVIATMRSKMAYTQEGKQVHKLGMAPIQRDGVEYEFDVIGEMDLEHKMLITKSRCAALDKKVFRYPGEDIAIELKKWLTDGAPVVDPVQKLLADLATVQEREAYVKLVAQAKALKPKMSAVQQEVVRDELGNAETRVKRFEEDAAEVARAEREMAAAAAKTPQQNVGGN